MKLQKNKSMTGEERYRMMTETPVSKLIPKMAVPTIISMLVTSIYNMADTFFVSQINTSASAAVGIIFSLMAMIQAVGFTLGMGGGNYISRTLGNRDDEKAERIAATAFFTAVFIGLLMTVGGILSLDWLVRTLGATETIVPYARAYAQYILLGAPIMTGSFVMNNLLRSQGFAFYSMLGITTGGTNIGWYPQYDTGSDLYLRISSGNLRCCAGDALKPVHQLLHPFISVQLP